MANASIPRSIPWLDSTCQRSEQMSTEAFPPAPSRAARARRYRLTTGGRSISDSFATRHGASSPSPYRASDEVVLRGLCATMRRAQGFGAASDARRAHPGRPRDRVPRDPGAHGAHGTQHSLLPKLTDLLPTRDFAALCQEARRSSPPRQNSRHTGENERARRSSRLALSLFSYGGGTGTRTPNPLLAKQVRYQLRHAPIRSNPTIIP